MKRALVTGATGQDGFYLTEYLMALGYEVCGTRRPSSQHRDLSEAVEWFECDLTDAASVNRAVQKAAPDEVYNLAAQSHVGVSFSNPALTFQVNAMGALNVLEAIRGTGVRFYQASTSELYGSEPSPQDEETRFHPRSPYGVAKLAAYWLTVNYREAYGLHASNGILFNHESPRRGVDFVTRKITRHVAKVAKGCTDALRLGNLGAMRDWGHARDFVRAMHLIVQQEAPGDYVIATGKTRTVREFVEAAYDAIGKPLYWVGSGLGECGLHDGRVMVCVDPKFFRPAEVDNLCGNPSKARATLGWAPSISFIDLVSEMVASDVNAMRNK